MKKKYVLYIFRALMFAGIFLILCRVGYSDGDDAFFYEYTHQMEFAEYLSWRYQTWVGRMAAEALIYLVFHLGVWFWRVANAAILTLLPIGILHLAKKAARVPSYGIGAAAAAAAGYLMMSVMTLGYAAVWVNGSVFYTWSFTCGIYALFPLADIVYREEGQQDTPSWKYLYALPLSVFAAMSIEQMGAVLLALLAAGILYLYIKKRKVPVFLWIQFFVTLASFLVLFMAPGNSLRVASETERWMPQFGTLNVGEHIFLTVQWLLSSFANESCLFFIAIWMVGCSLLSEKKEHAVWMIGGGIFAVSGFLAFIGVPLFSDMGIRIADITVCLEKIPVIGDLTAINGFALLWWSAALIFTFAFLWKVTGGQVTVLLVYLAGIASEAVMYFSPTIYASGERVYYLTDILYLFLLLCLTMQLQEERKQRMAYTVVVLLGVSNFISQLPVIVKNF